MAITLPFRQPASDRRHPGDYVPPKPDTTRTKLRITRACWATLQEGSAPSSIPAGTTLTLPRWQAQQIIDAGRGELV